MTHLTQDHALVQCKGKECMHHADAKRVANTMRRRSAKIKAAHVNAYHCPSCGFWHVGSSKPSTRNKRPRVTDSDLEASRGSGFPGLVSPRALRAVTKGGRR
jgi:hypothetical protein